MNKKWGGKSCLRELRSESGAIGMNDQQWVHYKKTANSCFNLYRRIGELCRQRHVSVEYNLRHANVRQIVWHCAAFFTRLSLRMRCRVMNKKHSLCEHWHDVQGNRVCKLVVFILQYDYIYIIRSVKEMIVLFLRVLYIQLFCEIYIGEKST